MRIDQRNAGAPVNVVNAVATYPVDRFLIFENTAAATVQGQQGNGPTGTGLNSLSVVNGTGASATAAQVAIAQHRVEGFNVADFVLGSAQAITFTLSFWVRSSVTGTYCVSFRNSAQNRSYVAEYTINAANTFEFKTVTLTGDTAGTWLTNNGIGLSLTWDLGSGSDYNATAGSWVASNGFRTTNQTNWINNTSATFFLSGVQLEAGSVATPFERRPFGAELALCQRYYETGAYSYVGGYASSAVVASVATQVYFKVTKRAIPTVVGTNDQGTFSASGIAVDGAALGRSNVAADRVNTGTFTASAEL
jgi:hypothetical protein